MKHNTPPVLVGSVSHSTGSTWLLHIVTPQSIRWEDKTFPSDAAAKKYAADHSMKFLPRGKS